MLLKVQGFFERYNSTFSPFPQFPPLINEIKDLVDTISKEAGVVISDFSGYTEQKNDDRTKLEEISGKVSSALLGYGAANGQPDIVEREDYLVSSLGKSPDSELYVLAVQLYRTALPVQGSLTPYGSGAADVTELNNAAEKFLPQIKVARNQRKVKSRAAKKVKELFVQADEALRKLDIYMNVYQHANSNLYTQYRFARKIDKRVGGHTLHKKRGHVLPGNVAHAAFKPEVLKANSKLILSNTKRGGDVVFYFSANANEKPTAQTKLTTVSFKQATNITAAEAGYTLHTKELNVLNPNVTIGAWKAQIEIE